MPSFFMMSESGDGLFLLRRLIREGHRGRVFISDNQSRDVGRGLVDIVSRPSPTKGDIVLFDSVRMGRAADAFRRDGFRVIGASSFADSIELDRARGTELMKRAGIKVPETKVYNTLGEARAFLKTQPLDAHWYFKPFGNVSAALTRDGSVPGLLRWIDYVARHLEKPKGFELQRRKEGTEISLEGWFDGQRWVLPFNSTVEDKKFLAGNLGPRTGCMANCVWAYTDARPILVLKTLARIEDVLRREGYVGPIDLNMILDSEGEPYGLEWSARFGYDALQALSLLISGDLGHQLADFSAGKLDEFNVKKDAYALTVGVSVPPYPNTAYAKHVKGWPLDPMILADPIRVMPRDVMVDKGVPQIAGADASVATIGDVGSNLWQLRKDVLDYVKRFEIPDAQYRPDPASRMEEVYSALSRFSYDLPALRAQATPPAVPYEIRAEVSGASRTGEAKNEDRPVERGRSPGESAVAAHAHAPVMIDN